MRLRETYVVSAALLVTVGLALSACSSSTTTSPPPSPTSTTSASSPTSGSTAPGAAEPTSGAGALSAIKANWATFFNFKTPNARRVALLQDGAMFAPVIAAQSHSSLAGSATSKVSKVSLTGTSQAAVTYTIYVGGSPALPNQAGIVVYQDGVWKVGAASFCALLKIENGGKTTGPGYPAACRHV